MEPGRQVEIQLGHMCNNRCVFCVSGQRTAMGEAGPTPVEPILERIREARSAGHHKVTLLGGEPTLQPGFLEVVRECVRLGFEEIVIFTNGAKTARAEVIDEVRATGGRFTWRISIQGATRESHERTTRKPGSFGRIERTLEHLKARGERITINMCVVRSNFEDVDRFPELLAPFGVRQLHLDMMRPLDAGVRTEEELRASIPRYSDLAAPMRRMIAGFPSGFDVNVGNLPYCVAPDLAAWIHHDGEPTDTIAVDGDGQLSRPWNKYLVKKRDKIKTERCRECVFDSRCSGVYETYARFYGTEELVPVDALALRARDREGRMRALWLAKMLGDLEPRELAPDRLAISDGALEIALGPRAAGAIASYEECDVELIAPGDVERVARELAALTPIHPLAADWILAPPLRHAIARLRKAAPFGALRWERLETSPQRAVLHLRAPGGEAASVTLALEGGRPRSRYDASASPSVVEGLRALFGALRSGAAEVSVP